MITLNAYEPTIVEGTRKNWTVEHFNAKITGVLIDGVWHQFEHDEEGVSLDKDIYNRDIYFQHDCMPEDELAYFTIALYEKARQLVMFPGNSNIQAIKLEDVTLVETSPVTQHDNCR